MHYTYTLHNVFEITVNTPGVFNEYLSMFLYNRGYKNTYFVCFIVSALLDLCVYIFEVINHCLQSKIDQITAI